MSGFTQHIDSPFPDQNALFDAAKVANAAQTYQSNQLHMQGQQMQLTAADHEQVGRLAAGLLNIQDPTARAQAYAQGVGVLQSQGLAKYAPPTLPDEGSLRMLVSQTVPVADQIKMGFYTPPGTKAVLDKVFGGGNTGTTTSTTGTGTTGTGTTGTGVATAPAGTIEPAAFNNATAVRDGLIKRGIDPDTATALAANALHESVANPATGRGDNGNSAGLFQWAGPRLQAYTDTYGHSPDGSPLDEQLDNVVRELKGSEAPAAAKIAEAQGPAAKAAAVSQYYLRPKDTVPEMQRRSATALQLQQQIGGGSATATAAPTTAQPGQPVPTQVAGPPMVSTAPAAPTAAPGGPPAAQQPGTTTAAAPPATTAAAPAQPTAPLATGINSPQFREAQDKLRQAYAIKAMPGYATSPQLQAAAGLLTEQAGALAKADTFQEDTQGGIHGQRSVLTNQFIPDPARRMMALADGTVINDQGKAIAKVPPQELVKDANNQYWYVPKYPTPGPGGTLAPAQPVPGQQLPTPGYVKEQEAEADRLSKMRDAVIDRAKESAAANTMIGNTETAMSEAQKGNVGPNALAPQKVQLVATAKALGIDLAPFGIDTSKLAAAQVTREQLQQLNGAILRKMYPQRITNADLAISGTVLPNYGLDEGALTANFDIYKKQNAYDTQMAQDMLTYEHEHNGSLKGWEQQWYSKNNFATGPLDTLFSGGQSRGGSSKPAEQSEQLPIVKNDDDFGKLKTGDKFIDPNGQRRVKP